MKKASIGSRIQRVREDRGITRSELAAKVSVTPAAVWNWEEQGTHPRQAVLRAVARVLGVPESDLVTGDNSAPTPVERSGDLPMEIIEEARRRIAAATGFPIERVKLKLELVPES
jgi:transcriptional regulator with XRE-family HTH domain